MTDQTWGDERWHEEYGHNFEARFSAAPRSMYMERLGELLRCSHRRFFLKSNGLEGKAEVPSEAYEIFSRRHNILKRMEKVRELPALPAVFEKLDKLLSDTNASSHDVAEVLALEPALTARLLTLVNSPLYGLKREGLKREVDQLEQAVTVLGMKQVHSIIVAVSVFTAFPRFTQQNFDSLRFWEHSLTVGIGARLIAKTLVEKRSMTVDPEDAFLAGLVHDVGKILIAQFFPDEHTNVRQLAHNENLTLYDAELAVLGIRHPELGCQLLQKWGIQEEIRWAVEFHHEPGAAGKLAGIVHLANLISRGIGFYPDTDQMPRLDPRAWESLGLADEVIESVGFLVLDQFSQTAHLLDA